MSLFDRVKKGLEGAVEKGAKLSKDAIDKTEKMNRIRRLRAQKNDIIREAGAFALESDEIVHAQIDAYRESIVALDHQIEELEAELEQVKEDAKETLEQAKEKTSEWVHGPTIYCANGHEMEEGQRFCGECGSPAVKPEEPEPVYCQNGHEMQPGQRFCGECGSPPATSEVASD